MSESWRGERRRKKEDSKRIEKNIKLSLSRRRRRRRSTGWGRRQRDGQTTGQGNVQLLGPCSRVPPWRLEAANAGVAVDVEWHLVSYSPAAASASSLSPALKSQHEHFLLSTSWTAATSSPSWGASSSSSASLCLCLEGNSRRGREGVEAALARNVQVELLIIFVTNVWWLTHSEMTRRRPQQPQWRSSPLLLPFSLSLSLPLLSLKGRRPPWRAPLDVAS